jgi:zinc transporter 2
VDVKEAKEDDGHGHSHGHGHDHDEDTEDKKRKLYTSTFLCLVFMILEVVGGYYAGSLAIMSDAAHMLTDVATNIVLIVSVALAEGGSDDVRATFGNHRSEVMGALLSVMMIWALTGILLYEAVLRTIEILGPDPSVMVDGEIMSIVAFFGIVFNIFNLAVLGHGHSHGGDDHGHSHGDGGEDDGMLTRLCKCLRGDDDMEGTVIDAAITHVITDLLQSVGVLIAGLMIYFRPDWQIADPISTFLFGLMVFKSTFAIIGKNIDTLMNKAPKSIDPDIIQSGLAALDTVTEVHDLHIWSVKSGFVSLSVHVTTNQADCGLALEACQKYLNGKNIRHHTIQVEHPNSNIKECEPCPTNRRRYAIHAET